MYNVITSFGDYPAILKNGQPGPYTEEELGLKWIKHVASFSAPGMLKRYRLVLLLARDVVIPDSYNLDLDQWGDKRRFDENNKVQPWPVGPNMIFQQIQWLYVHGKLQGPMLWCEPDCIPVQPTWLDDLFGEYERAKKPFMGLLIDAVTRNGIRSPKHMTGNAIYPDKAYTIAPLLLECHGTAWDVYAANQILRNFHSTNLIQHDLNEVDVPRPNPAAVLYHPDKTGYLISRLEQDGHYERLTQDVERNPAQNAISGKPLVDVFMAEEAYKTLDQMLNEIRLLCQSDKDNQRKVAYFMLEHDIINQGHLGQHMKKKRKAAVADLLTTAAEHAESAE